MTKKVILTTASVLFAVSVGLSAQPSYAAEGGTGDYLLGTRGIDSGLTPPPGIFLSNQTYFYRATAQKPLPIMGGAIGVNARALAGVDIPTLTWVTPLEILGGRFGVAVTAPVGHVDIRANIGPIRRGDSAGTYGDPILTGFLGWQAGHFHWQVGVSGFIPIGDYTPGALANISKNRGALYSYAALTWLDPALGLSISGTVGYTVNQTNSSTQYRTGNEISLEGGIKKMLTDQLSIGLVGYHYQQTTGDSGPGAILGSFKGRVSALGPALGYTFKVGQIPVSTQIRYYREFNNEHRMKGDAVFLTMSMPLWVPSAAAPPTTIVSK